MTCYFRHMAALAASAVLFVAQSVSAAPIWQVNPLGTGASSAIPLSVASVGGVGFVQIIPNADASNGFQFIEHGAYQLQQPGTGAEFSGADLTVTYTVGGSGNFLDPFALRFTSGSIGLYADTTHDFATDTAHYGADNGTLIARFSVFDGGINTTGLVSVRALVDTGSLMAGYLFSENGVDLATDSGISMELGVFNQTTDPDPLLVAEIVCGLAGYAGAGCGGTPAEFMNSPLAFTVKDGGFATVIASVPEPGSLALLLSGLIMLACSVQWPVVAWPSARKSHAHVTRLRRHAG